ncbi:uncharacterized protein [Argopecten irradians]|uniref:uncharacterized protein isoform X2 n=1 Tax=Argopecten irradians TaxID=31199 RepID=UPI00370F8B3F
MAITAIVTASTPVVSSIDKGVSSQAIAGTLTPTVDTVNQESSTAVSNGEGKTASIDQTFSPSGFNGDATSSVGNSQLFLSSDTIVGGSSKSENNFVSSTTRSTLNSNTAYQAETSINGGDSTFMLTASPGSDVILPVASSVFTAFSSNTVYVTLDRVTPPLTTFTGGLTSTASLGPSSPDSQMSGSSVLTSNSSYTLLQSSLTYISSTPNIINSDIHMSSTINQPSSVSSTISTKDLPLQTIASSEYLSNSFIQSSATLPLYSSHLNSVLTTDPVISDAASSLFVYNSFSIMPSSSYIMQTSTPIVSQGVASSYIMKSYSSVLDVTSNSDVTSLTPTITISPTKASSIVQSGFQTTVPIVVGSSRVMSALSSNAFSLNMSSDFVADSSKSFSTPAFSPSVLTSDLTMSTLPVLPNPTLNVSSSMASTKVYAPSSNPSVISHRTTTESVSSSFVSSLIASVQSPSGTQSIMTSGVTLATSYSLPLPFSPSVVRTSTYSSSSLFVPLTNFTASLSVSLPGTIAPTMTSAMTNLISVYSSGSMVTTVPNLNATEGSTAMTSMLSSLYMSSPGLNISTVSATRPSDVLTPTLYPTPTPVMSQQSPSISLPVMPIRSSMNMHSVYSTIQTSSIVSFYTPRPSFATSGNMSAAITPASVIVSKSASSMMTSDFTTAVSSTTNYYMTPVLNISSSFSSVPHSTNFSPMPLPSTNVTGSLSTIKSSVIYPSFAYSTDVYPSTTSTALLVSQTTHSAMINLTQRVSSITGTILPSVPYYTSSLDASLNTNSFNATMTLTSDNSMNLASMTIMTSSPVLNSSVLLPTAVQSTPTGIQPSPTATQPTPTATQLTPTSIQPSPTATQPTPTSIQPSTTTEPLTSLNSSTAVSPSSVVMANASSVLVSSSSTSEMAPSMTSRVVPDLTSSFSPSVSSTISNQTQPSSVPVVTEPTMFTTLLSTTSISISLNMTSPSMSLSSSEYLPSVLPTSSDISSPNTTAIISPTSAHLMSSSMPINATSTTSAPIMTSLANQTLPSTVTMPTTSDTTMPTSVSVTPTPALNVTTQPSISTTPPTVENITSSSMTLDNVTTVNGTDTMSANATTVMPTNATDSMSTSVAPVTTTTEPTTTQTTTTPTTTEPPSTTNSFMVTYWTVTVIRVPVATNVSGDDFVTAMETGLAKLYLIAYSRISDIDAGSFDSRKKRKRRKRAVTDGDITVTMQNVKRDESDPESVSMIYTVEKAEQPVPSAANAENINLVSDQEMAIQLQHVVTQKAKPLNWVAPVTTTTVATTAPVEENNTQVWLIAVVAGGVAILIVIAIVGLCIATKNKKSGVDEEAEPRLMNLKNAPLDDDEEDVVRSNSKYSSMADQGSSSNLKVQSPKKQSYEINSDTRSKEEDEHLYAEVKKPKKPDLASKIGKSKGFSQDGLDSENMAEDVELIGSPKKKKGDKSRRKHKRKDGDMEDDEVITKTIHPASLLVPQSQPLTENAYYSAEEEDELKKRKAAERKKNKQRIREKKKKEKHNDKSADQLMVEYLAAQEEIDDVLEAPSNNKDLPDVFVHKKKRGSKSNLEGHDNMALTAKESLNVARSRMHELLDDAFSLISPSQTSVIQNQPPEDEGFHSPRTSPRSRSQLMLLNQRNANKVYPADIDALTIGDKQEDFDLYGSEVILVDSRAPTPYSGSYDVRGSSTMKHSPLKMESYKGEPILQTWSPYRAADQVALISMPNKMQTNIGRTPSGRTKRPTADLVGKKSKDSIPKPAFLKSRDLMSTKGSTVDLSSTKSQNGDLASRAGKGKSTLSEDGDQAAEETTEILQPNDQFEDTEISRENSMLPSIRDRKLAKAAKKRAKNGGGGGMEMKTLNGKVGQKHKEPFKSVPNGEDEMDIITRSVQSAVTPASTVNSIRNELKSGLPDKNVVTSFSGPGRNSRASGSLVDIA